MVAIVPIVAGLYYGLGSIVLLRKILGTEEYDVVTPTGGSRPKTESNTGGQGILSFQAGLHTNQWIADSDAWGSTAQQAYTVKIPWEVHLRRKRPAANLYNVDDPYWTAWAEARAERQMDGWGAAAQEQLESRGLASVAQLVAKLKPDLPLPKEVEFRLEGQWWDTNWGNAAVDDMTIRFHGKEEFKEVTLADMRAKNEGTSGTVTLEVDGTTQTLEDQARPTFFDVVHNVHFGVYSDWMLWFKGPLVLKPSRTSEDQLRRWFDYENPEKVNLKLENDATGEQELDLDW